MQTVTSTFLYLPIGLVNDIIFHTNLVASEIVSIKYAGASTYITYLKSLDEIEEDLVNMEVIYTVEDGMEHSFPIYIEKLITKLVEQTKTLNKCWSLTND